MEKNTVCLSLEKYDELVNKVKLANAEIESLEDQVDALEEDIEELENEIESMNEVQSNLVEYIIKEKVGEHKLAVYYMEDLINIDGYGFALSEKDYNELIYMGVSKEQIIDEIVLLKHRYDALHNKEEQDGNK